MGCTASIFKRELKGYFATPVAYVFIVFFLFLTLMSVESAKWRTR